MEIFFRILLGGILLGWLFAIIYRKRQEILGVAKEIQFYIIVNGKEVYTKEIKMRFNQKVKVNLAIKTAKGAPAKVDGIPTWQVSNPEATTMTVADDGLSAEFVSHEIEDLLNSIAVEADADRGEGVRKIAAVAALPVLGDDAELLELTIGEAEDLEIEPPVEA